MSLDWPDGLARCRRNASAQASKFAQASSLERIAEPQRTIELACFLKHRLEVRTDGTIDLFNHLVNDVVRRARDRATRTLAWQASPLPKLVTKIDEPVQNKALSGDELRASLTALIKPFRSEQRPITRAMATRQELCVAINDLSRLLAAATGLDFNLSANHRLAEAFAVLEIATDKELPLGQRNVFGRAWEGFVADGDRTAAHRSWTAATVLLIKRSLRNGSASIPHSRDHRDLDKHLIPHDIWEKHRGRFRCNLMPQKSFQAYVARIEAALETGLEQVLLGLEADRLRIVEDQYHSQNLPNQRLATALNPRAASFWSRLVRSSLPTSSSRSTGSLECHTVLGRPPPFNPEQVFLYIATVALGFDLTSADIERMEADVSADSVGQMMRKLEASGRLGKANDAFAAFTETNVRGGGMTASADMTSLDVAPTLWSARSDLRRKTPAMETYAPFLINGH